MKCIILGGSGQVGMAVVREQIKSKKCFQRTMLVRRTVIGLSDEAKIE